LLQIFSLPAVVPRFMRGIQDGGDALKKLALKILNGVRSY